MQAHVEPTSNVEPTDANVVVGDPTDSGEPTYANVVVGDPEIETGEAYMIAPSME